jgi:hypothetical protein
MRALFLQVGFLPINIQKMFVKAYYQKLVSNRDKFLNDFLINLKKIEGNDQTYPEISPLAYYFDENTSIADGRFSFKIMDFTFYMEGVIYSANKMPILINTYEIVNDTERLMALHKKHGYPETKILIPQLTLTVNDNDKINLIEFENPSPYEMFFPSVFWEYCKRLISYIDNIHPAK